MKSMIIRVLRRTVITSNIIKSDTATTQYKTVHTLLLQYSHERSIFNIDDVIQNVGNRERSTDAHSQIVFVRRLYLPSHSGCLCVSRTNIKIKTSRTKVMYLIISTDVKLCSATGSRHVFFSWNNKLFGRATQRCAAFVLRRSGRNIRRVLDRERR